MKLDFTKLPILEGVVVFFIVVLGITFVGAFAATDDSGGGAVAESPAPDETPEDGEDGATPDGGSPSPGGPAQIIMQDNSFDPGELTVPAGSTATFEVTNDGRAIHNVHIAGEGGEYTEDFCEGGGDPCSDPNTISGGETGTLHWQVPAQPGEVPFRCDFHPEEMTGTITIQ